MLDPNDTLVIDVKRHNPAAFSRMQSDCADLPLKPGWRSSSHAYLTAAGVGWHWNNNPPPPPGVTPSPALPPPPNSAFGRATVSHHLKAEPYRAWDYMWQILKEVLQLPRLELVRVYLNAYPFGCDTGVHQDSAYEDEVTIVLPVHEDWHVDYGGETAVVDERDEIGRAVLPVPGRAFIFRSALRHAARPVSRSCSIVRRVAVFKCGSWPVDMPIRSRAPDDLEQPNKPLEPFAHLASLSGTARLAAAATWLSRTPAATWPHGKTNFASHLTTTALYAHALGADETTMFAALAHAVFGTQHYRRRLLDPVRDRALAEQVFGKDATALALRFSSVDREALTTWKTILSNGGTAPADGIRLDRHANAPEAGNPIHLDDLKDLERLLIIEAANFLTMTPDPTNIDIQRNVDAVTRLPPTD